MKKVKGREFKVRTSQTCVDEFVKRMKKAMGPLPPTGIVKNADGDKVYEASYYGYSRMMRDRGLGSLGGMMSDYNEVLSLYRSMYERKRYGMVVDALAEVLKIGEKEIFRSIADFFEYFAGNPVCDKDGNVSMLSRMRESGQSARDTSSTSIN